MRKIVSIVEPPPTDRHGLYVVTFENEDGIVSESPVYMNKETLKVRQMDDWFARNCTPKLCKKIEEYEDALQEMSWEERA